MSKLNIQETNQKSSQSVMQLSTCLQGSEPFCPYSWQMPDQ